MKINLDYDGYDIKYLDDIEDSANEILQRCDNLSQFGVVMRRRIDLAHQDFDTVNFDRMYQSIAKYMSDLADFQSEVEELSKSAKEFHEIIKGRWS